MFDIKIILLTIALLILMAANVSLGSIGAWFDGAFEKKKMAKGMKKSAAIVLIFVMVYVAGMLTQEIAAFNINGQVVNLVQAVYTILVGGYIYYGFQVLSKLIKFTNAKVVIKQDEIGHDKEP